MLKEAGVARVRRSHEQSIVSTGSSSDAECAVPDDSDVEMLADDILRKKPRKLRKKPRKRR